MDAPHYKEYLLQLNDENYSQRQFAIGILNSLISKMNLTQKESCFEALLGKMNDEICVVRKNAINALSLLSSQMKLTETQEYNYVKALLSRVEAHDEGEDIIVKSQKSLSSYLKKPTVSKDLIKLCIEKAILFAQKYFQEYFHAKCRVAIELFSILSSKMTDEQRESCIQAASTLLIRNRKFERSYAIMSLEALAVAMNDKQLSACIEPLLLSVGDPDTFFAHETKEAFFKLFTILLNKVNKNNFSAWSLTFIKLINNPGIGEAVRQLALNALNSLIIKGSQTIKTQQFNTIVEQIVAENNGDSPELILLATTISLCQSIAPLLAHNNPEERKDGEEVEQGVVSMSLS